MDAAEALAIACNTKITAMKDVDANTLGRGIYLGTNDLVQCLREDKTGVQVSDNRV